MAKATFVQDGGRHQLHAGDGSGSGSVVAIGDLIGITRTEIKANNLGSLAVAGVFGHRERSCRRDQRWNEGLLESRTTNHRDGGNGK